MARNVTTETAATEAKKNRQVNATIPGDLFDALNDHRWEARIDTMPKLVSLALTEYAENHGLLTAPAEAPAGTPAE